MAIITNRWDTIQKLLPLYPSSTETVAELEVRVERALQKHGFKKEGEWFEKKVLPVKLYVTDNGSATVRANFPKKGSDTLSVQVEGGYCGHEYVAVLLEMDNMTVDTYQKIGRELIPESEYYKLEFPK